MKISMQSFRGIVELHADIAPILLLAGDNGAGKSSACVAIAATASGSMLPFEGVKKKDAQQLVYDGDTQAVSVLSVDGGGTASASWPACERATAGLFRDASPVAVGLEDITAMKAIDRAARLITLIGAEPTQAEFVEALTAAKVEPEFHKDLWGLIQKSGWDGAHTSIKDSAAKLKGQWEQVTREKFGTAKMLSWRPKTWELDLEAAELGALQTAVLGAQDALNDLTRQSGANTATLDMLTAEADKLAGAQREFTEAVKDLDSAMKKAFDLSAALDKLGVKPKQDAAPLVCPCCQAPVRLIDGALVKPDKSDDPEKLAMAMAAYEQAEGAKLRAVEMRELARTYVTSAENKVKAATDAKEKLAKLPKEGSSEADIAAATAVLEKARTSLGIKSAVLDALGLAKRIQRGLAMVDVLDKDGVRQAALVDRLGAFNSELMEVCEGAGWRPVHIDADMAISYRGRTFSLCSGGEQFRARVVIQIAIALREEAPLLVIDEADVLDRAGRNGLLRLLSQLDIPAVVGMTVLKREEMPDLEKAGIGKSIWIENGGAAKPEKEAA